MWNLGKIEYLNIGCGPVRYADHLNLDLYRNPAVDLDIQADCRWLPFRNEVFKGIIASHILEHIKRYFHEFALAECWRVLQPDGQLYIEVPDLKRATEFFATNYKGRREAWYQVIFGRQAAEGDDHLSGFTEEYLTDLLFGNGFGHLKWQPPTPSYSPYRTQPVLTVTATKVKFNRWTKGFSTYGDE